VRKSAVRVAAMVTVLAMAPAPVFLAAAPAALAAPRSAAARACTTWAHTTSPNAGTGDNNLYGITAISARDAWAVGEAFVGVNTETLIEHWNGKSWKVAASPNKGTGDELMAVYAVSAANVWAAGSYGNGTAGRTLIEHWNGKSWKVIPSPNIGSGSNDLLSIRGTSAHDIWAVGNAVTSYPVDVTVVLHWNGKHWKVARSPSMTGKPNFLTGVRPLSPASAWAVGSYVSGTGNKTLILRWSKGHWRIVPSPNVGAVTNYLRGVLATSATSAWTVGDYSNTGAVVKTLILHWNGKHWRKSVSPNVGVNSNELEAIGATSPDNVYAVGDTTVGTTSKVLIVHWDGKHWRVVPGRDPGSSYSQLVAVFAQSPTLIWAAGSYSNGGFSRTLIERCR
jgi:hypothetical protein